MPLDKERKSKARREMIDKVAFELNLKEFLWVEMKERTYPSQNKQHKQSGGHRTSNTQKIIQYGQGTCTQGNEKWG